MDEHVPSSEEMNAPRPRWQVWLARVAVAVVVIGYLLYLLQIAGRI